MLASELIIAGTVALPSSSLLTLFISGYQLAAYSAGLTMFAEA